METNEEQSNGLASKEHPNSPGQEGSNNSAQEQNLDYDTNGDADEQDEDLSTYSDDDSIIKLEGDEDDDLTKLEED